MITHTTWVKADGTVLLIAQMSEAHLSNSIAMIERQRAFQKFPQYNRLRRELEARILAKSVGILLPVPLNVEPSR